MKIGNLEITLECDHPFVWKPYIMKGRFKDLQDQKYFGQVWFFIVCWGWFEFQVIKLK